MADNSVVQIQVRIPRVIKRKLEAATRKSGRSQNAEINYHLERSLWLDELLAAKLISSGPLSRQGRDG